MMRPAVSCSKFVFEYTSVLILTVLTVGASRSTARLPAQTAVAQAYMYS